MKEKYIHMQKYIHDEDFKVISLSPFFVVLKLQKFYVYDKQKRIDVLDEKRNKKLHLHSFIYNDIDITDNLFTLIEFNSILKSYIQSKINTKTGYKFDKLDIDFQIKTKDQKINLAIKFKDQKEYIFLNKIECTMLHDNLSKIISKLELLWLD